MKDKILDKIRKKNGLTVPPVNALTAPEPDPLPASAKPLKKPIKPPAPEWRLPHGSRYDVTYDAERKLWVGTLSIPVPGDTYIATGSKGGVFPLLRMLDQKYRDWLKEKGGSASCE